MAKQARTLWGRIALVLPLFNSNREGEVLNAVSAIKRILESEGLDLHALAKRIDVPPADDPPWEEPKAKPNGGDRRREEPPKWTKEEPRQRAQQDHGPRRRPSAWKQDTDDVKRAYERAGHHDSRLDDWSMDFLASVHEWVVDNGRSLTERQRDKLNEILDKLGI